MLSKFQSDFTDTGGGQIHYLNTFMQTPVRLSCHDDIFLKNAISRISNVPEISLHNFLPGLIFLFCKTKMICGHLLTD